METKLMKRSELTFDGQRIVLRKIRGEYVIHREIFDYDNADPNVPSGSHFVSGDYFRLLSSALVQYQKRIKAAGYIDFPLPDKDPELETEAQKVKRTGRY